MVEVYGKKYTDTIWMLVDPDSLSDTDCFRDDRSGDLLVSRGQTAVPRRGLSIVDYKRPRRIISPCAEQRSGHARLVTYVVLE